MSILASAHADYTICTTVVNLHQCNTEKNIFGKLKIRISNVNFCEQNKSTQSSRKRRIMRIGMQILCMGRIVFTRREFCVCMFF